MKHSRDRTVEDEAQSDQTFYQVIVLGEIGLFTLVFAIFSFYYLPKVVATFQTMRGVASPEITQFLIAFSSYSQSIPLLPFLPSLMFVALVVMARLGNSREVLVMSHILFLCFTLVTVFVILIGVFHPMFSIQEALQ